MNTELAASWALAQQADTAEFLGAAARAGFDAVHLQPRQVVDPALGGAAGIAARCRELGIKVSGLDPLINGLPGAPAPEDLSNNWSRGFVEVSEAQTLEAAAESGATVINVAQFLCARSSLSALADAFAGMCQRAAQYGISLAFEFIPAISDVADLPTATELLGAAGSPVNGGLMLDTWHLNRSGGGAADLRRAAPNTIIAVQLNDARREDHDNPAEPPPDRLVPGEGVMPLDAIVEATFAHHAPRTVAVEVFSRELFRSPVELALARCHDAGRALLDRLADRQARTGR